ncbi:MAG: TonB-dependent receptor [Cytophagales bacterium]|nr:TonB-dependent receptor [Cytophagales bacterium]
MKRNHFGIFIMLLGHIGMAQTAFLDSITDPGYIAWEYELDEVIIGTDDDDTYNASLRFYKSNALCSNDEIMEKLVGVWAMKRGNYAFEPVMRGLSSGQINVTIDEMRILGACTDRMDPVTSYVEPNNLDKLHIRQGASGFISGSTVGGSFDMQINKPVFGNPKQWITSAGSRYSIADRGFSGLFNTGYSGNRSALRLAGSYRKAANYRAGGGEIVEHSSYNKTNLSASGSLLSGKKGLLNVSWIGDFAWDVGYPALPMDVGSAKANIIGLTYDAWNISPSFDQLTVKVYYNRVEHVMDDANRKVLVHMDMPGNTSTLGAFVKSAYRIGERAAGQIKIDAYRSLAHAEMTMYIAESPPMYMLTWPDVKRNVIGIQNHFAYKLDDKTDLMAGVRIESNRVGMKSDLGERQVSVFQFGDPNAGEVLLNASLGTERSIGKRLMAGLKAGYGQRMPTESEQYGFFLFNAYDGYDYVGRPDLESERSVQLEGNMDFGTEVFKFSLTGFYYYFDRYIMGVIDPELSPMTIGANGVKVYQNLDYASLAGIESRISAHWRNLTARNTTKFTSGRTVDKTPLPLIPPLKSNLEVSYQTKNHWAFNAGVEAATRQDRINESFGETPTPAYSIANLMVDKSWVLNEVKLKVSLRVLNLFDTYYHEHLDWGGIPRIGRNTEMSVFVSF